MKKSILIKVSKLSGSYKFPRSGKCKNLAY